MHVDDFLDSPRLPSDPANYAGFFLEIARMPAWKQFAYEPFMRQHKLFCTYADKRYRVTGASRLGDVWLTEDHNRQHGYDLRVDIADCSDWKDAP